MEQIELFGCKIENNTYESFNKRHFVCNCFLFDAYLVESIVLPDLILRDEKQVSDGCIEIMLHDTQKPSTKKILFEKAQKLNKQTNEWIKSFIV